MGAPGISKRSLASCILAKGQVTIKYSVHGVSVSRIVGLPSLLS